MGEKFRGRRMASFIVRLSWARRGRLSGIVERVATGEKCRFSDASDLGGVIAQIVQGGAAHSRDRRRGPGAGTTSERAHQ